MADLNSGYAYIEDLKLYGPPNKVLAQILVGNQMYNLVAEYVLKVAIHFTTKEARSPYRDRTRQYRRGGHTPGQQVRNMDYDVAMGNDRWIGQITLREDYSGADQYGRKKYARYRGSQSLRESLHAVLPHQP
ncbi:hypothetical protein Wildcat_33 [Mycobacterium phage Wildcat]|uniref:Uncharacterized protein n=4 Tax=Mycobacterium virus Wildcat TaxID=1993859 RepID=Q19Y27_9CAUD|nr:neck protein [Mycobacterium phage Wildcat]AJD82105.1 hypothetical protein COSMO_33 [Mycobacterium phage Cosmo]AQT25705.1 hypothetical protein EniyanLRS_30 [Mycobacterium phage EniyanLRS]QGJ89923.1 hypothetical protein PBI_MARYV_33 [Mycobacterium phage MaryV]WKR36043.1 neck protein [Mycobacterium phage Azrael100]ABE67638.1 hypothetical protein Wildcat_33 [Mycobacterium phage Wildcat]